MTIADIVIASIACSAVAAAATAAVRVAKIREQELGTYQKAGAWELPKAAMAAWAAGYVAGAAIMSFLPGGDAGNAAWPLQAGGHLAATVVIGSVVHDWMTRKRGARQSTLAAEMCARFDAWTASKFDEEKKGSFARAHLTLERRLHELRRAMRVTMIATPAGGVMTGLTLAAAETEGIGVLPRLGIAAAAIVLTNMGARHSLGLNEPDEKVEPQNTEQVTG